MSHFHVPDDVLEHDDGVIHDKTDGQRQRHQRQRIQAVAEQIHRGECADDRENDGRAWNQGGRKVSQKEKDDHDDQRNRQDERELDVVDGAANGFRAVVKQVELHCRRKSRLKLRQKSSERCSTISTVFVPGWRETARMMLRVPLFHAMVLLSSTLSMTFASSSSRNATPLRHSTISGRYAAASINCPLDWTVKDCFGPRSRPVGRFTLLCCTARCTSSIPT